MKRKSVTTIRHLLEKQGVIFLRLGSLVRGSLGGIQNRNTAKKTAKTAIPHQNSMKYRNRTRKCYIVDLK